MKTEEECLKMLKATGRQKEQILNIKLRNGQGFEAIRKTLEWVTDTQY